jgi:hypothetical protein
LPHPPTAAQTATAATIRRATRRRVRGWTGMRAPFPLPAGVTPVCWFPTLPPATGCDNHAPAG